MGDAITGGTVYDLAGARSDSGDILMQEFVFVDPSWDYHRLWQELFPIGVRMLSETVAAIERGEAVRRKQDERFATWEPSWGRPMLKRNESGD